MAEYSQVERTELLRLAHTAILSQFKNGLHLPAVPSEHLAQQRGAFTTLHLEGRLRGCIGYVVAMKSLWETVIETAQAAAFEDPRFAPVSEMEAEHLQIEISVLSPMFPIKAEDVVVGTHGLLVTHHGRRGLLLPQVPLEWGWDRETFLAETCRKAGLPSDAWKHGAAFEAFTAEVFAEATPGESLRQPAACEQ